MAIEMESSDTVEDLKHQIFDKLGMPIARQQLLFAGELLKDHYSLADYNIQHASVIRLTFAWPTPFTIQVKFKKRHQVTNKQIEDTLDFRATEDTTIQNLKEKITEKLSIPLDHQSIRDMDGRILNIGHTFVRNEVVELVLLLTPVDTSELWLPIDMWLLVVEYWGDQNRNLYYAAKNTKEDEVVYLLSLKAEVNWRNHTNDGDTALMAAVQSRSSPRGIVNMLIEAKTKLNMKDDNQLTALTHALGHRRWENAKALVEEKAGVNRIMDQEGRTPLYIATKAKQLDLVKALCDARADLDAKSDVPWEREWPCRVCTFLNEQDGCVITCQICQTENITLDVGSRVKAQFARGRDQNKFPGKVQQVNRGTKTFNIQFDDGSKRDRCPAAELEQLEQSTPLICAATDAHSEIVDVLLAGKADTDAKQLFGVTPLIACMAGKSKESNSNSKSKYFYYSSDTNKILQSLLDAKANVSAKQNDGKTALTIAQERDAKSNAVTMLHSALATQKKQKQRNHPNKNKNLHTFLFEEKQLII